MATKIKSWQLRSVVSEKILAGEGAHLVKRIAEHFGVARSTANRALQDLIDEKWLTRTGGTRPIYELGENRQIAKTYLIKDIEEDIVWSHDFKPIFELPKNIYDIAQFGFTEILNNAIDHSEGEFVSVFMSIQDRTLRIIISDDGVGIFKKISQALSLPDPRLSILELSKGKFTTDPSNHSGQGIFFTSRMFDKFQIESDDLVYDHDIVRKNDYLYDVDKKNGGTLVFMKISLDSKKTSKEIFLEYTTDKEDYGFDKTVVPVRLAVFGNENLVSRSQAKRFVARFDGFKTVILDFNGVELIGQAFADQIFRIFASEHHEVRLLFMNANEEVTRMIKRAKKEL